MARSSGRWPRWRPAWFWAALRLRSSILLICLASALALPGWSETSGDSEPGWPELQSCLSEIDRGLQMIGTASDEIESSQAQREQRLIKTEQSLDERELLLQQRGDRLLRKEQLLDEREQGLNAREQDLQERGSLYGDMQATLGDATAAIHRATAWGSSGRSSRSLWVPVAQL